MIFIKGVPNIKIKYNNVYMFEIKTVKVFKEYEDRIILKCAEEIPEFKRGFVCDMELIFNAFNINAEIVQKKKRYCSRRGFSLYK